MNPETLLQTIDALHAMKNIPREVIFRALEESMAAAVRKRFGEGEDLICTIDRDSGEVTIEDDEGVYVHPREDDAEDDAEEGARRRDLYRALLVLARGGARSIRAARRPAWPAETRARSSPCFVDRTGTTSVPSQFTAGGEKSRVWADAARGAARL